MPLAERVREVEGEVDLIVATSLTCLSSLFGLLRRSRLAAKPCLYYMHENQLTYPIRQGGKRDSQLILRQFHSQLVADAVWFNSDFNRRSWFEALPSFLRRFPDHHGLETLQALEDKSEVVPLGLDFSPSVEPPQRRRQILLWNQRWEWEKGIDRFLEVLKRLGPEAPFDVVVLGGEPVREDPAREELKAFLGPRLLHCGWCERDAYEEWLRRGDFTISVARHEFFGISLLEAAGHGLMTFLPCDLAYPELLPESLHQVCLYRSLKSLTGRIQRYLNRPEDYFESRQKLAEVARSYLWSKVVDRYDEGATTLVQSCSA